MTDYLLLGLLWVGYFAFHSLLASLFVKRAVSRYRPAWMPYYRIVFNALASGLLIPPLWLTFHLEGGTYLWQWQGPLGWLADGLALLAFGGFLWTLRYYDLGEFLGLRQWRTRQRSVTDQEGFHLSPLHRFVRHPWYALALVLLWTRDMDPARLLATTLVTAYFILGSRLEERKLLQYHGRIYQEYLRRVPALVPCPWHYLHRAEAEEMVAGRAARDSARGEE